MLCKLFTFLVQHLLNILASSSKIFTVDFWPTSAIDFSYMEFDAYICFSLFTVSGKSLNSVITWSHLVSVVTVEWKQLSHRPEQPFLFPFHHVPFDSQEAHLTLALLAVRQRNMLLSWKNEEKVWTRDGKGSRIRISTTFCRNSKIELML